jgi:hypothetical protein
MAKKSQQHSDERLGTKIVAVTVVVLLVLFGLYWGGKQLLLAPTDELAETPGEEATAPLTPCEDGVVYHSLGDALAAAEPCILDASGQGLTQLSPNIGHLSSLRTLNLSGNQIANLPSQLGYLKTLTDLNLSNNTLNEFPVWIGYMPVLEKLDISNNQIPDIGGWIGLVPQLRELRASNNQILSVAEQIGYLERLEMLDLSNNQLRRLPDRADRLRSLRRLDLSGNPLPIGEVNRIQTLFPEAEITF